jgi:hypothetical protein
VLLNCPGDLRATYPMGWRRLGYGLLLGIVPPELLNYNYSLKLNKTNWIELLFLSLKVFYPHGLKAGQPGRATDPASQLLLLSLSSPGKVEK